MALEKVDLLYLFGFLSISIVIFENGLMPSNPNALPIITYNDAFKECQKLVSDPNMLIPEGENLPVKTDQGILYCAFNKTRVGYHVYREEPDVWYNMEARRCDIHSWCKNGTVSNSFFYWTCDSNIKAVRWAGHNEDPCPEELATLTRAEAEEVCKKGNLEQLSKIWICASEEENVVKEIGWTSQKNA